MSVIMKALNRLVTNPQHGFSEKDFIKDGYHLNARNYAYDIEKLIDEELKHTRYKSPAGRIYTTYKAVNAEQIRKLAEVYNAKLQAGKNRKSYANFTPFSESQIQHAITQLGKQA